MADDERAASTVAQEVAAGVEPPSAITEPGFPAVAAFENAVVDAVEKVVEDVDRVVFFDHDDKPAAPPVPVDQDPGPVGEIIRAGEAIAGDA